MSDVVASLRRRPWIHIALSLCPAEHQVPRPKCLLLNKRSKEWLHTFCCKVLGLEEEDFSSEADMVPGVQNLRCLNLAGLLLHGCSFAAALHGELQR